MPSLCEVFGGGTAVVRGASCRGRTRRRRGGALILVLTALLSACGGGGGTGATASGSQATGEPRAGGSFTYASLSDAGTLDPARCGTNDWLACSAVFGTLLTYDPVRRSFGPGMAESFTSGDGKVWTLRLRPGLTFTDGTPFDADAVVANWARVRDPANFAAGASIAASMQWAVVDPSTVRVELGAPNYQLPWAMYNELAMIGSPEAIRAKGKDFANAPVGAGPFTVQSWARGTQMTLARNAGYWDRPRPYVDTLVIKTIPAEEQRLNALRSGDVDAAVTLQPATAKAGRAAGLAVAELPFPLGVGLRMSFVTGDLADPGVRTAVGKLVNAAQLREAFWPGLPVQDTMAPVGSPYLDATATYPAHDVAGAQALVDDYLRRTGKNTVTLELKILAGNPQGEAQAQMLQAQLQAARGVQVAIIAQDPAVWFADTQRGNFQLQVFGVSGVNLDQLYKYFHTGASGNTTGYSNPDVDRLLEATHATADAEQQLQAYRGVIRVLTETLAYRAWTSTTATVFSKADAVGGLEPAFTYFIRPDLVWVTTSGAR